MYAIASIQQDASAVSLAATAVYMNGVGQNKTLTLIHVMTSGTTSATTFKVRVGPQSAGSIYLNGSSAARLFGGVSQSVLTVQEIY